MNQAPLVLSNRADGDIWHVRTYHYVLGTNSDATIRGCNSHIYYL
jgi:hypothetical protein